MTAYVSGIAAAIAASQSDSTDNWNAASPIGNGWSPDTTITGPTLDVTASTNYTDDTISNVTGITFETTAGAAATFKATQFGTGQIASNATITGDAHADQVNVYVAAGQAFGGSQLQFSGWTASDKFEFHVTGDNATITGTSGNDVIEMGAFYDATDVINGGNGSNTLQLNGNYNNYVDIAAPMLQNINEIAFVAGNNYSINMQSGAVAAGKTITIDAATLDASGSDNIYLSNDTAGSYEVELGAANNFVYLNGDQADTVVGGSGINQIVIDGVMAAGDKIEGAGNTSLTLSGDYSAGYRFGAHELTGNIAIYLDSGFSYNLTLNNGNVPAGSTMVVNGSDIGTANSFILNGSHVTGGSLDIVAGAGLDYLTGSAGNDNINFRNGPLLTAADHVNGEGGTENTLNLEGDYSSKLDFGSDTMRNIQDIYLYNGYNYSLVLAADNVPAGQSLDVQGYSLGASYSLDLYGEKVSGNLDLEGGAGNDKLVGGSGTNTFFGAGGADSITCGTGSNILQYGLVSDSTSTTHDTITGFNAATDKFQFFESVHIPNAMDAAVTVGGLGNSDFDANLAAAIGADQLHANDAVLFTPSSGAQAGHTFLIVDENGVAGYQAGADLVIELTGATNLSQFSLSNFVG